MCTDVSRRDIMFDCLFFDFLNSHRMQSSDSMVLATIPKLYFYICNSKPRPPPDLWSDKSTSAIHHRDSIYTCRKLSSYSPFSLVQCPSLSQRIALHALVCVTRNLGLTFPNPLSQNFQYFT